MVSQFTAHCDVNNLLPGYQLAYRRNYSCETALIKITNDCLWDMENQMVTGMVAIDLSAAFDTVDHAILLDVLNKKFGVHNIALKWFNDYLSFRSCKVSLHRVHSKEHQLPFSVPEGSVAGPVLYNAYASTLQHVVQSPIKLYGFADDHIIKDSFMPDNVIDSESYVITIESCITSIKHWMGRNRLKMNSAKTDFILIGSRQQLVKCKMTSILVNDEILQRSPIIKHLGALIDERLSFKQFINSKCRMAMWNLQKLKPISNVLTDDTCKTLISALVLLHLDYANAILIGLPEVDIKKMQIVQNMAAKLVLYCSTMESSTCLRNLHWLPIRARIEHKLLTMTYKCLNGEAPDYLSDLLSVIPESKRMLRLSNKYKQLVVPRVKRKTFVDRSFSIMAPSLWSELPDSLQKANGVEIFKAELKTLLFRRYCM